MDDGPDNPPRIVRNQPEIEREIRDFYEQLYAPRETKSEKDDLRQFMGEGFQELENVVDRNVCSDMKDQIEKKYQKQKLWMQLKVENIV